MLYINRPLRSTDAERRRNFASAIYGGKNSNGLTLKTVRVPERHEAFIADSCPAAKGYFFDTDFTDYED